METLERILREHPFLQGMDEDHIRFMVGCAKNVRIAPDQLICKEGETAGDLMLLREGKIALEVDVPGRGATTVETVVAGDILGWTCLFPEYAWQVDGRSLEQVRAIVFDGKCLREKVEADKVLGFALAKRLLSTLHKRLERIRMQNLDVYGARAL